MMHQQFEHTFVAFCVLYTVASFLSWLLQQLTQQRQRIVEFISPAITPRSGALDYNNEDLLLRKALTAVHWQLIANKATALHFIKKAPIKPSASFTFGTRSFSVPSLPCANYSKKYRHL